MSREQDLHGYVDSVLGEAFVVDEVSITPAGRRRVVRVTVDRPLDSLTGDEPVPPLSLDEVAEATRLVSAALDDSDVLGSQPYTLEVSTPGVGRPLSTPAHFRRNVGRLVELTPREGPTVTGRVLRTTADEVVLEMPAEGGTPVREEVLAVAEVRRAVVEVEFSRPVLGAGEDIGVAADETGEPGDPAEERN